MGWFSDAWKGDDPKIITKEVWDPLKKPVSTPMSSFLAENIGKGLPRYEGKLHEPLDPDAMNRYSEFMGLDAGAWFDKAVGDPETKRFKEDLLPEITEGFAGNLRGSGRYRAEEAGINQFSESLAQERAKALPSIAGQQYEMGMGKAAYETAGLQAEYADWMKSLPEYNPVLDKALAFLAGPTGRDLITAVDPGQQGWLKDLAQMSVDMTAAIFGSSRSGSASGQKGGVTQPNVSDGTTGSQYSTSLSQSPYYPT